MKGKLKFSCHYFGRAKEPTSSGAPNYNKLNGKNQTCNKQQPKSSIVQLFIRNHTIKIEK
jgi:hypothetical protein